MKNTSQYAHLTRDEAIREILKNAGLEDAFANGKIRRAMEDAFREGWLRGEEYEYNRTH